jgi:hypothetical protein
MNQALNQPVHPGYPELMGNVSKEKAIKQKW